MSTPCAVVDTNLIVRYLVQDHKPHAEAATEFFNACNRGEITLLLLPVVLAETVFVLESFYETPRARIASVLAEMIRSPGVRIEQARLYGDALRRYGATRLHFVDCVLAAHAAAADVPVASFDRGFAAFSDIKLRSAL
jgi:predicted nucleic-acid-binding protein